MRRAAILTSVTAVVAAALFAPMPTASAATTTLQLENGTIFHGTVDSDHPGYTGTGFVNSANEIGAYVEWSVPAASASAVTLVFRYSEGVATSRPATVALNGTTVASYSNLNKATGYSQKTIDLSAYAGQSVTLKFNGVEDSSLQTSFVIDDTSIQTS